MDPGYLAMSTFIDLTLFTGSQNSTEWKDHNLPYWWTFEQFSSFLYHKHCCNEWDTCHEMKALTQECPRREVAMTESSISLPVIPSQFSVTPTTVRVLQAPEGTTAYIQSTRSQHIMCPFACSKITRLLLPSLSVSILTFHTYHWKTGLSATTYQQSLPTRELLRNVNLWALPHNPSQNLHFDKSPGKDICTLKKWLKGAISWMYWLKFEGRGKESSQWAENPVIQGKVKVTWTFWNREEKLGTK